MCRGCGAGAPTDAHFCPACDRILPLGAPPDYFAFLGLPRRLTLDSQTLERQFRALSRQFHPDFFHNRPAAERVASLERSSYLNDAYRTLRQPLGRIEYLLGLENGNAKRDGDRVPASLLEEVFELNEELDAVREMRDAGASSSEWKSRLNAARQPIEAKRDAHERELEALSAKWDALGEGGSEQERRLVLAALQERMLERNYIRNLLAGIQRELESS